MPRLETPALRTSGFFCWFLTFTLRSGSLGMPGSFFSSAENTITELESPILCVLTGFDWDVSLAVFYLENVSRDPSQRYLRLTCSTHGDFKMFSSSSKR